MKSTIKDVAMLAGVSPATVSLVLNEKKGIKAQTRERVLQAVKTLNYRPNEVARNLINRRSDTVGVIVTDMSNPFFSTLTYKMQKKFEHLEKDILIGISNNKWSNEKKLIESMVRRGVDGLILVPCNDETRDLEYLYDLKQMDIPLVYVTCKHRGVQFDCVMTDFEQAMFDLTDMLIKKGERRIVFFCESRDIVYVQYRINGYKKAYKANNLKYEENWIVETDLANVENAMNMTKEQILLLNPDAIITINALSALGIMTILKKEGIKVPKDISVACFDEFPYNDILYQPLTYANQNLDRICDECIEIMLSRISGDKEDYREIYIPGEIIMKGSTKS